MFNLNIKGELGTVLPSELAATSTPFGKAWQNFLREIDTAGVKISSAHIENAGKTNSLPTEVKVGA